MVVELMLTRTPEFEAELKRDFKPFEVMEGDFTYDLVIDGRRAILNRRQRKVRYVSADQNSIREVINDLGEATGEDAYAMPCDGVVEMAQAWELIDWAKRKAAERRARQTWVGPIRKAAFLQAVADSTEESVKRALRASTFGPIQRIQR